VQEHANLQACFESLGQPRWFAFTTRGTRRHDEIEYADGDALVFGPETRGLPDDVLELCPPERAIAHPDARGSAQPQPVERGGRGRVRGVRRSGWKGTGDDLQ